VDELRAAGRRVGLLKIRYMRPFPAAQIAAALAGAKAAAVLEKDVSFGFEGTVFTNVNSALHQAGLGVPTVNVIGGLGGDDISAAQVLGMFAQLEAVAQDPAAAQKVTFLGVDSPEGGE